MVIVTARSCPTSPYSHKARMARGTLTLSKLQWKRLPISECVNYATWDISNATQSIACELHVDGREAFHGFGMSF